MVENVVAAGCWMVHAINNSKMVVAGVDVAVEAGNAGTAVVDSRVAGSETTACSKMAQTH